jgi:hypothetical protein
MNIKDLTTEQYSLYVGLLTDFEHDILVGEPYAPDSYFNPIQDADDKWVISVEEIDQCVNPDYLWVKDLPLIPYNPKPTPPFP